MRLLAPDGYESAITADEAPEQLLLRVEVDIAPGTRECGLLLRATADGDHSYILRLEPQRNRIVFDRWPRSRTGPAQWQISGDQPYAVELERPCDLRPGRHLLEVLVDGSALVAVLDREVALSARIYDRASGRIGLFVGEGEARFFNLTVLQRSPSHTEKESR
jgi:beta-fructofuranosidase